MISPELDVSAAARKERESAFHDAAFAEDRRRTVRGFYRIAEPARERYDDLLDLEPAGARVLEFGCGQNASAFRLAREGCRVTAIDISKVAIEDARREAARLGLGHRASFEQMDAENLYFDDGVFDLVCGTGILHHLDLDAAVHQIWRVLRPGGRAVFMEPLGHNLLVNAFRRLTPALRTADEHPLTAADLRFLELNFAQMRVDYVALLALLAAPLLRLPGADALLGAMHRTDASLLRAFPGLGRFSWLCVIELRKATP
jgi:SAM-dependent methyltransferase